MPKPTRTLQQRVAKHGVLYPLAVRPIGQRQYEILTHPTTWVAAGLAGVRELPVMVHEGISDATAAGIVEDHYNGGDLNPIDEALAFEEQLEALGGRERRGAVSKLSRRIGVARSFIVHSLRLLELPEAIQRQVASGELSAGQARPLITVRGVQRQGALARKIIAQGLSARQAEGLARENRGTSRAVVEEPALDHDADVKRLESRVSEQIGSPFEIRGHEAVFNFFGDYEVLDGLLSRMGYQDECGLCCIPDERVR